MPEPQILTGDKSALSAFVDRFDTFLFDCDGVLWSGDHLFEGVPEALEALSKRDAEVVDLRRDSIVGSSFASAAYIANTLRHQPPKNKVFVLGEAGITDELDALGVPWIGGPDLAFRRDFDASTDFARIASGEALDPNVSIVLSGLDFHPSYLKLSHAFAYIQRGSTFLATNPDTTLPNARALFPGAGSTTAPLIAASGKQPITLGKPAKEMMDAIASTIGGRQLS
ncbi:MAG: hypothetical protein Q9159_001051 [Coniocarpon cinnabarinum]